MLAVAVAHAAPHLREIFDPAQTSHAWFNAPGETMRVNNQKAAMFETLAASLT
ncbi:uncharacterized protein BXZ73DRAFT_100165 [Epithele typhae]|uniref:uncharacterized protein n=1 Tax=Epithele typhae TaxID=378194 RepID=UPI0020073B0F|nr:uncharacterized protein BXZ73DRAFT_100165 [Epithele typhae]KAH9936745.1 hypothetical protein BXZ73DRAFT_100165 [Epithele typhae]